MKRVISSFLVLALAFLTAACSPTPEEGYIIIKKELLTQSYTVAFRYGDEDSCDAVSAALSVLAANGTAESLSKKYLNGSELTIAADAGALDDLSVRKRTLTVGISDDRPPMSYTDSNGAFKGFDVEMAAEACGLLGWELEYRVMEYDDRAELESGNIDCVWGGFTITSSIKKQLTCSDTYLDYEQVLVTRAGTGHKTFGSLKGEKLAAPSDRAAEALLTLDDPVTPGDATIKKYDTYSQCFEALDSGEVQGVIIGSISAQWYADNF